MQFNSLVISILLTLHSVYSQTSIDLYLVEECPNNTIVTDLSSIFPTSMTDQSIFRLLSSHKLFYIDRLKTQLKTRARIDREAICEHSKECSTKVSILYQPRSVAASKPVTIRAIVHILDLNDNAPRWPDQALPTSVSPGQFILDIPEHSTPNSEYTIPEAVDPDRAPDNTTRKYIITRDFHPGPVIRNRGYPQELFDIKLEKPRSDGSSKFVGSRLRLVLLRDLDREEQESYNLRVVAIDGGRPSKSGELKLTVRVTDINDHAPKFTVPSNPVRLKLQEDASVNKLVYHFLATDVDSDDRDNLKFRFAHDTPSHVREKFWLKERTGQLMLQHYLDYETRKQFQFNVEVSDGKFNTRVGVLVQVLNVNDNAPVITISAMSGSSQSLSVPENQPPNQNIGLVVIRDADEPEDATDSDSSSSFQFKCSVDNPFLRLSPLHEDNKALFLLATTRTFDRERTSFHVFSVTCQDSGLPQPQTATVTSRLYIADVNDNKPRLLPSPLRTKLKENAPLDTYFYQLGAQDNDSAENADFRFFVEAESRNHFRINDKTGQLYTKRIFDAETSQHIKIHVGVSDRANKTGQGTHYVRGMIDLEIEDENDHTPLFQQDIYHFRIAENSKAGTTIARVSARDGDVLPVNSRVHYRFKADTDRATRSHLQLSRSGRLSVRGPTLDRETTPSFNFYVIASDSGSPALSSSAYVQVEVQDVNDNAPYWVSRAEAINITYRLPVGHEITQFQAKDADVGSNRQLKYFLARGGGHGIFQLHPTSGVLYVTRTMTVKDIRLYHLTVGVRDHGQPALSQLRNFKVYVVYQLRQGKGGRYALFGKFEGDLLIILILVIITLVICLGLISAIWFLKCGRQTGMWLQRRRYNQRESMRPPDGHSPSPSNEIMPVFLSHSGDSFLSNFTKASFLDRNQIPDNQKNQYRFSGTESSSPPPSSSFINNNIAGHYQCLRHVKDTNNNPHPHPHQQQQQQGMIMSGTILTRHNSLGRQQQSEFEMSPHSRAHSISPPPTTTTAASTMPVPGYNSKSLTLLATTNTSQNSTKPQHQASQSAGSQLSVKWLDKQQPHHDDHDAHDDSCLPPQSVGTGQNTQYQICISTSARSTPKYPILKITNNNNSNNQSQTMNNELNSASLSTAANSEYTQLAHTSSFKSTMHNPIDTRHFCLQHRVNNNNGRGDDDDHDDSDLPLTYV